MIKVNGGFTYFSDLKIGDYFITTIRDDVIWKKINGTDTIQITDNDKYIMFARGFLTNQRIKKIKITSINYKIK